MKIRHSIKSQAQSGSTAPPQPEPESEEVRALKYAILAVPLAEPGKLPAKPDEAAVTLARSLGREASVAQVWQEVRDLANRTNPLIRLAGAGWELTAAGKREHTELLMEDLVRRREALKHSQFKAWCELESAVYQAIGCLHLLQETLGRKMIEESGNVADLTAAGIYHLSDTTTKRLNAAFDSVHQLSSAGESN